MNLTRIFFYSTLLVLAFSISVNAEASNLQTFTTKRKTERQNIVVPQNNNSVKNTIVQSQEEEQILHKINELRAQKKAAPLENNVTLRNIAENQIRNPNTEYSKENLRASMANMPIFPAKKSTIEDCNCIGTNDVYRQLKIPFTSIDTVVKVLQQEPTIVSTDIQYIGLRILNNEANILLAGREEIPFTPPSHNTIVQYRREVVRLINRERTRANLPVLQIQDSLQRSAQQYAQQMWEEKFYGHTDPLGKTAEDRIEAAGYFNLDRIDCDCEAVSFAVGENIAKGQTTPAQVVRDWMKSDGHRKNILSQEFTDVGIGVYGNRWVQHFAVTYTY